MSRVLRTVERPPSQTWKTFLKNHVGEIVAIDFFTVPILRLQVLFVFLVLEHQRRKVLHFGVTEHPSAEWAAQQVVEAFIEREAKPYLIRDRDVIYGNEFPTPNSIVGDQRDHHRATKSLAERIRRAADWLDST